MIAVGKERPLLGVLEPLHDVEGVIGAALWDSAGRLLERDLPDLWGTDVLREVGTRVAYLYQAFGGDAGQFSGTTLVFPEHKLQLRPFGAAIIGILLAMDANVSALQMALNIAVRQLGEAQARSPGGAGDRGSRLPEPAPAQPPAGVRLYRGQRLPE